MLMFLKFSMSTYMFIIGILSFIMTRKHLLSTLLSLEFIVLSLFFMMMMSLNLFNNEYYISMMFLTFSVCEGALGVSILVMLIRTHSNDYFNTFSVLQC